MADEKPLTKSGLVAALKEIGVATKKDFADVVHEQLTNYHADMVAPEFERLHGEISELREQTKEGFTQVDRRLSRLEADVSAIKNDVKGLEDEFGLMPSRKKITELEERVEGLESSNASL